MTKNGLLPKKLWVGLDENVYSVTITYALQVYGYNTLTFMCMLYLTCYNIMVKVN